MLCIRGNGSVNGGDIDCMYGSVSVCFSDVSIREREATLKLTSEDGNIARQDEMNVIYIICERESPD